MLINAFSEHHLEGTINKKICNGIETLKQNFHKNELAYLAITGKIESFFRDNLAFILHTQNTSDLIVLREWKRIDIAILNFNKRPVGFIEIKSAYSFDACLGSGISRYFEYLKSDLFKDKDKHQSVGSQLIAILIVTHLEEFSEANMALDNCKYIQWHRKARSAFSQEEMKAKLSSGADESIKSVGFQAIDDGDIRAGTAFDIPVTVFYWVLRLKK